VKHDGRLESRALQWRNECEMMLTLNHPNIVRAFSVPPDIVKIADSRFSLLAMEFCADGDLRKVFDIHSFIRSFTLSLFSINH